VNPEGLKPPLQSSPSMALRIPRPSGGNLGRTKNIIHFVQAFIIFLAWALTIAIWTKGDGIDGRTVYYWILVSILVDIRSS
jgi:hypothetical protein